MLKISDISKSFFLEDWDIYGYFDMLKDRFFRVHDIFLREYGSAGQYLFWGLVFFLAVILCIYIKLLSDMLKRSDKAQEEDSDEEYVDEHDSEEVSKAVSEADSEADADIIVEEQPQVVSENAEQQADLFDLTAENYGESVAEDNENIDEEEEMEKKLSVDIVQKSKVSDDYLNLKDVLYKQSKDNNSSQKTEQKTKSSAILKQDSVWDLDQTVGIIINMLAHRVSDKKIAQSIHYLNKGADDPEEIIQLIKAIKNFVGYCNTAKFDALPNRKSLPENKEVLLALAERDNKPCMELMELLLNAQIALAQRQSGLSKELSYALAADYACTMGTLANISNYELAITSFELALDMAPKNVSALSRCADMYWQDNNAAKAVELYQQVLNLADDVIYPEQKANANLKLAQYYRTSGKMFKADEMEKDGRKFFDDYGISVPLSDAEKKTSQVLLDEQGEKMADFVDNLL